MKGIDISHYQGNIDFAKVKADGAEIVYIKATEGLTYNDPLFKQNYTNAKAVGLKVGLYHFLKGNDPVDEAKHFLEVTSGYTVDCLYMIDVEDSHIVSGISDRINKFADYLNSQGKKSVLYTYESYFNSYIKSTNLPLWIAKYSTNKPSVGMNYIGWQYTSSGSVNGIDARVDMDNFESGILLPTIIINKVMEVLNGMDIRTLQTFLNKNGFTDSEGKVLVVDGKEGPRTKSAKAKAKSVLSYILK